MSSRPRKRRPPSASAARRAAASELLETLARTYPDAHCELDYATPFQLLVATILSAQCTDERVNRVTPELFRRFPTAEAMAEATQAELEVLVRSTGFYRNKAKSILASAKGITERFGGEVPRTMDELLSLRGAARKTANVVLGNAYAINEGVVVDTHVSRLSQRLGLTREKTPEKIERVLMGLFERERWAMLSHLLIWHGRRRCRARKPDCAGCELADRCPRRGVKT